MTSDLYLYTCSRKDAEFACKHWHYSCTCPTGAGAVYIGVAEYGKFIGVIIFSAGANRNIGSPFGLDSTEVLELTRVALRAHTTHVTRILAIAIKMLAKLRPFVKLIISYADADEGHKGIIYKAGNWTYLGPTVGNTARYRTSTGKNLHKRTVHAKVGAFNESVIQSLRLSKYRSAGKHKFCYYLRGRSKDSVAGINHIHKAGAIPSRPLT